MTSADIDFSIKNFRAQVSASTQDECLHLESWGDEEWKQFFRFTTPRKVPAGEELIHRGEHQRTLYVVLRGDLEVVVRMGDGMSVGPLNKISAGSVVGEISFFDGKPRSAHAWAITDSEVAAMTPDQYVEFEKSNPDLARDFIFSLGRIMANRVRTASYLFVSSAGNY